MSIAPAMRLWTGPTTVWLALLLLLAITVTSAYIPLGGFNTIFSMMVAAIKVALVALFFMNIRSSTALVRLGALAGVFWLIFMFSLTFADYLTR